MCSCFTGFFSEKKCSVFELRRREGIISNVYGFGRKFWAPRQVIGSFKVRNESVCIFFAKGQVNIYFTDETPKLTIIHQDIIGYIEDIYIFEVNTKYISSSVLKTSEFS